MRAQVAVAALALAFAGCGSAARTVATATSPGAASRPQAPARGAVTAEEVVLGWADALDHDLNERAAGYFAPGALVVQGDERALLATRADAAAFNASLPCQGRVVAMSRDGNVVTAVFVLDNRGTFACGGVGTSDTVAFTIVDGKIAVWERLPD